MLTWFKQILAPPAFEDDDTGFSFTMRYALLGTLFGVLFPLLAMGILLFTRALPLHPSSLAEMQRAEPLLWIIDTAPFFLGLFAAIAGRREDRLRQAYIRLQREKEGTLQLQQLTRQLERRSAQLNISADISRRLSTILDLEVLLAEVVNQVKNNFGYYHTHIYLLDDLEEKLVVAAGTGLAGAELKQLGHSIPLDAPASLVARAARNGEIVKVDNVREAEDWLPNPLLPDTCAEMAVPITLGTEGQVVGVLDVQEDRIAGLDESDADLLRSLANQVAVAIRNAHLFADVERALAEARAAQERYAEIVWEKSRIVARGGQHRYTHPGLPALDEATIAAARQQARQQSQPGIIAVDGIGSNPKSKTQNPKTMVAPVTLQNAVIGTLQVHPADSDRAWTEDDLAIVEAVTDELAQIAENLRLFDETRERAGREQAIREITDKLRAAPNLDAMLSIAARELGQRLGVPHTVLEMGIEAEPAAGDRAGNGQVDDRMEVA